MVSPPERRGKIIPKTEGKRGELERKRGFLSRWRNRGYLRPGEEGDRWVAGRGKNLFRGKFFCAGLVPGGLATTIPRGGSRGRRPKGKKEL